MSGFLNVFKLLIVTFFTRATAHVNDSELFPYLESAGSSRFYFGDDGYAAVNLEKRFKFLGRTYNAAYISGNGYITFGAGMKQHYERLRMLMQKHLAFKIFSPSF